MLAAFGRGKRRDRSSCPTWLEGKPPDRVLEVASPGTARNDLREKRRAHAAMGCRSYWLFDPTGELYPRGRRRPQGLALADGKCEPLEEHVEGGCGWSAAGFGLARGRRPLRFRDPATGKDIRHRKESDAAVDEEAERADREAAGRRAEAAERKAAQARAGRAEARVAELETALQRLRIRSSDDPP